MHRLTSLYFELVCHKSKNYVREPDVITAEPKATTRIRLYWRGNSDVALDGAGVKPAKGAD